MRGMGIGASARITGRFVKKYMDILSNNFDRLAVESYSIFIRVSFNTGLSDCPTVNRNPTGSDYCLAMAP